MCSFRGAVTNFPGIYLVASPIRPSDRNLRITSPINEGAQPVSMDMDNFTQLVMQDDKQDWLASWKADGTTSSLSLLEDFSLNEPSGWVLWQERGT